jgi:type I restriction enzyme S subunit
MLPDGWHRSTLGEIARITSGGTPDRSEPSYWGGSVPWVTTGEIQFNTITDTAEKITEAGLKNSSAKLFPPGTLLMAMYGQGKTRGQVAKLAIEACTNQNSAAILLHEGHDPDFYFHFLSWKYDEIRDFGHSGGVSHLNAGLLKQIAVPVAPVKEQQRIAQILSAWDEAIESADRLASNAKLAMSAVIERSILRGAKRGAWPMRHLSDIATRVQRSEFAEPDLPVLMISSGAGFVRQDEKYSRFMAGKSVESYIALEEGDFAYNKGNSKRYEFGCVFPLKGLPKGLVPHVYVCFRLNDDHVPGFFEHLFAADFLHDQLGALVNTGVRNNGLLNIRPADFMACKVPVPPPEEQETIAARLDVAAQWVRRSDEYAARIREEKAALLVDLLTGKRRVRQSPAEAVR